MKDLIIVLVIAGVLGGGYYYSHHKKEVDGVIQNANDVKDHVVATGTAGIDSAIAEAIKSIDSVALAYYAKNRNYGISVNENFCTNDTSGKSVGAVIGVIETYTKAVTCVTAKEYPAKSFTIVASSVLNTGKNYCTDAGGYKGLIEKNSQTFKPGYSCK